MILFLISFLMVFVSSYLIASVFEIKKFKTGLIYLYLIMFAQIVFTVEFLSLFKAISQVGILIMNIIILLGAIFFWKKNEKPLYKPDVKQFWVKIFKAIKKDKMLGVMGLGFLFFIAITVFLCALVPVLEYDSLAYHFNRAIMWVSQGSLAHFDIADDRNINMAINSEILYTWFLTFVPRNLFIRFFTFADYIFALIALSAFLEVNKFSMRKQLWTIFLFSSLAGVTVGASGVETNIMIGALALVGVCLFQIGVKKALIAPIYFSSLAFALAIGAKTSVFFMLPGIAIILFYLTYKYQRQNISRYLFIFAGFSILNFILFAAYNYILNFLEFGSLMGSASTIDYHKMTGGVKGYISGLIRHLVLLLDFTGFTYGIFLGKVVFAIQTKLLNLMHIPLDLNVISGNENRLNIWMNDSVLGGGVIGVFVMLPCALIAIFRALFCGKSDRYKLFALFALNIFLSIAVMSASLGFMKFSSRFVLSFLIFASPILAISYIKSNKNIFKYLILFYVLSYFLVMSTHIGARHFINIVKEFKKGNGIHTVRDTCLCSSSIGFTGKTPFCVLRTQLYKLPKGSRIGVWVSTIDNAAIVKFMDFDGYKLDTLLLEKLHKYNLEDYDYLVFTKENPVATYIRDTQEVVNNYYVENKKLMFKDSNKAECIITRHDGNFLITADNVNNENSGLITCAIPYQILTEKGFKKMGQIIYKQYDETDVMSIFKR